MTNTVTATRVADAVTALGADPTLATAPDEVVEVAGVADVLVLNCGTPSAERFAAMHAAARAARGGGHPIVLDPVGCGASAWRTERIRELARDATPDVVRGNAAEVAALAGITGGPALRGIRSDGAGSETLERIARSASAALGTVVLSTGQGSDIAADGATVHVLAVDAAVLSHVVGAGDVLSAIVGVWLARGIKPIDAVLAAHAAFATAARAAAGQGPGGFWPRFIDALAARG